MENKKEMLSKAYEEGKTIQYFNSIEWTDFVPHNQVDSPNFDYKIDNWRIKPEIEDKEIQPEDIWNKKKREGIKKLILEETSETPWERMYTRDEMFLFAGFVQGKKYSNPEMDLTEIMEEWEKIFKHTP